MIAPLCSGTEIFGCMPSPTDSMIRWMAPGGAGPVRERTNSRSTMRSAYHSLVFDLHRTTPADADYRALVAGLDADLRDRYGPDQDIYDGHNILSTQACVVIAFDGDMPVGCGAFRPYDPRSAEIKRMFVPPVHRGRGVARAVLAALEQWAAERGCTRAVLETGVHQTEAIALYRKTGYVSIEKYGPYVGLPSSCCFAKTL
jgi:GNAT superfamily N-acetyltransferase